MKHANWLVLVLASASVAPVALNAQGFESLVKNVSDINFFFSCWNTRGDVEQKDNCLKGQNGFGVQVSYDVTRIRLAGTKTTAPGGWKLVRKEYSTSATGKRDSTLIYEEKPDEVTLSQYVLVELAVGWSQFSGFKSTDPSFELKGSVREVPSLSVYGSLSSDDTTSILNRAGPYVGIRSGLIQLQNVQLLRPISADTVQVYGGSAQTFQLGLVAGLAVEVIDSVNLFIENAWQMRKFSSVQWSNGSNTIRPEFPTQLDFSGKTLTIGVQLTL